MMGRLLLILFISAIFLTPLIIFPATIDYYNPPKELFSQLIIIFCLWLYIRKDLDKGRFTIARNSLYLPLLVFCIILGLSIFWAGSRYLALRDYAQFLTYIGAFFICVNIMRQKTASSLAVFALIAGFISSIYAVFQYLGLDFIKYPQAAFPDWRFRLYSTFGNPDFLANYLILIFPVGVALYLSAKRPVKKLLFFLMLVIIYVAILITFSVGALLGLVFGILFMACLFSLSPISYLGRSLAALVIILGLITAFLFPPILNKARSSVAWQYGWANRVFVYRSAYLMGRDNALLGVGIGNFKLKFPEYRAKLIAKQKREVDSDVLDREKDKNVLNEFLQLWVEAGLLGLAMFIFLLAMIFKKGVNLYLNIFEYRGKLFVLGLAGGISAFLIHSLFSFPLHVVANSLLFWTFAGLLFVHSAHRPPFTISINPINKKVLKVEIILMAIALSIWPARVYLGDAFLKRMSDFNKKGLIDKAFMEAQSSLFFNPNSDAAIFMGHYLNFKKDYKNAAGYFAEALENNDEINLHVALAEAYFKQGSIDESIGEYKKAVSLNPSSAKMRDRLAEICERQFAK